jgi:hypothetical protein
VPLSEHEQRLLDQIEQALYAEDPKFASTVRSTDLRTVARRRMRLAAGLFVIGLGVLIAGAVYPYMLGGTFPALGVLGFCIMLAAAVYGWSQYKRRMGRPDLRVAGSESAAPRPRKQQRVSPLQRLEERFKRRFDER